MVDTEQVRDLAIVEKRADSQSRELDAVFDILASSTALSGR